MRNFWVRPRAYGVVGFGVEVIPLSLLERQHLKIERCPSQSRHSKIPYLAILHKSVDRRSEKGRINLLL